MKKLLLLLSIVSFFSCSNSEKEKENESETTEKTYTSSLIAGTYNTEANSHINWKGEKITGNHFGKLSLKDGKFEVNNGTIINGSFTLDMKSITVDDIEDKVDNADLVSHLKDDDFFSSEKYPTATLEIKEAKIIGENKYDFISDLTIKGIKKEISFQANIIQNQNQLQIEAKDVEIDRTAFDIKYKSSKFFDGLGDKAIYDMIKISFQLNATKN